MKKERKGDEEREEKEMNIEEKEDESPLTSKAATTLVGLV